MSTAVSFSPCFICFQLTVFDGRLNGVHEAMAVKGGFGADDPLEDTIHVAGVLPAKASM